MRGAHSPSTPACDTTAPSTIAIALCAASRFAHAPPGASARARSHEVTADPRVAVVDRAGRAQRRARRREIAVQIADRDRAMRGVDARRDRRERARARDRRRLHRRRRWLAVAAITRGGEREHQHGANHRRSVSEARAWRSNGICVLR
jgi:hypothetical protein